MGLEEGAATISGVGSLHRRVTREVLTLSASRTNREHTGFKHTQHGLKPLRRPLRRIAPLAPDTGASWTDPWPRPARLLSVPEPIETVALLPDHPPVTFTWRGVRHRVNHADGPERVFGEWWKHDAEATAMRDYFQVENDAGERFWIYRSGDGEDGATGSQRWFLHGIFG